MGAILQPFYLGGQTQTTSSLATQNKRAARRSGQAAIYPGVPEDLPAARASGGDLFDDAAASKFLDTPAKPYLAKNAQKAG